MRNEHCTKEFDNRPESILELLEQLGPVPSNVQILILTEKNLTVLQNWFQLAIEVESLEDFMHQMTAVRSASLPPSVPWIPV